MPYVRASAPAYFTDPDALREVLREANFADLDALQDAFSTANRTLFSFLNQPRVEGSVSDVIEEDAEYFNKLSCVVSETAAGRIAKTTDDLEERARIFLKHRLDTEVMWPELIGVVLEVLSSRSKISVSIEEAAR